MKARVDASRILFCALSVVFAAVVAGCQSSDSDRVKELEQTIEALVPPESGVSPTPSVVEQLAMDFLQAIEDQDADRYRSFQDPEERQSEDEARESLDTVLHDTQGCNVDDQDYAIGESDPEGIAAYVAFNPPCGSGGVTSSCEVRMIRRDGMWWVGFWKCQ